MSPCVAGKSPALFFHGICNLLGTCPLCLQVKIRVRIQPCQLIIIQVIRPGLVADIRTIAQNTVISGQCHNSFMSVICKIRMRFHKAVDQRHNIIVAHHSASVILHILIAHLAVLIYYKLGGNSISVLGMIVAHIIL